MMPITVRRETNVRPPSVAVVNRRALSSPKSFMDAFEKATKTPTKQRAELLALADRFESRVRRKFIAAVNAIRDNAKLREVAALIESGAPASDVARALGVDALPAYMGSVTDELGAAYASGGVSAVTDAAEGVTGGPKVLVRFDGSAERAASWVRDRGAELVTAISLDTAAIIRSSLADSLTAGETPLRAAMNLRSMIGLTERQAAAVQNYRRYLLDRDRRALARNVGGTSERIIEAAFRDDTMTAAKVDSLVSSYANRLLRQRANTIAQTESFRALNAGAQEGWQQVLEQTGIPSGYVRRFWVATNDQRTRDAHLEIPLMNADGVAVDEPFQSPLGPIMFPGDPDAEPSNSINCRCTTVVRFVNVPEAALPPVIAGRSYLPGAADFVDQTQ